MATATFDGTGADPTDWQAGDNWSGGSGASGVPAAGDDVRVGVLTKNVTGNTAAFAAINIASFKVAAGCEKSLGAGATPITFGTCTTFDYSGRGQSASFSMTATTATIEVGRGKEVILAGGIWTTTTATGQGNVIKGASATCTTVKSCGPIWSDEAGSAYVTFWAAAGRANLRCSVGTIYAMIPVLTEGAAAVTTKAWIYPGGSIVHWSTGTITDAEIFPKATLTYRDTPATSAVLTNHTYWAGSTVQKASPGFSLTETNPGVAIGNPIFVGSPVPIAPAAA